MSHVTTTPPVTGSTRPQSALVVHGLSPDQTDGIACAVCALPFRVGDRSTPVGYAPDGAQVFACADTCAVWTPGGAQ